MFTNILCEAPTDTLRVVRFLRPDLRNVLYDHEAITETTLYKELSEEVFAGLQPGGTVILNFGLIDWFPTAFYRILLQAYQDVRALGGRVVVCCLTENVKEGFEIMGGSKLFDVHSTEAKAIATVKK